MGALSFEPEALHLVPARPFLYIGCYTNQTPVGICIFRAGGSLTEIGELSGIENPSFLTPHPSGNVLYAVSETSDGNGTGGKVVSLAIEPTDGSLTPLQEFPSGGDAPCHLSVDREGTHLWVANYVSGSVTGYRLQEDGQISEIAFTRSHVGAGPSERQEGPHAHCAVAHRYLPGFVVADLGNDTLVHYSADGAVEAQMNLPPGTGPRHVAWHPILPVCFVVGELDNTITRIEFDRHTGRLAATGTTSTLPADFDGPSLAAEIRVNPAGTRLYVSNRGHDSIAVFDITTVAPELVAHVRSGGHSPRNFALDPTSAALVVANQDSNNLKRFAIDPDDGVPILLDEHYEVSEPVCVTFMGPTT
ncbi:MAG: lactonase family protein [Acidimicrobiales bacterium]